MWLFRVGTPKWWTARPIVIDMEYRCSKGALGYVARDIQNAISAVKSGIDGMVDAGVIENDSKRWLHWGRVTLITRKCPKGDGITITVRAR